MLQLRETDRRALQVALNRFPEVRRAWIFGSRAKGRAARASDIDLAIEAPTLTPMRWHELNDVLEQAPIIYKLDVVHLDTLQDKALMQAILNNRQSL